MKQNPNDMEIVDAIELTLKREKHPSLRLELIEAIKEVVIPYLTSPKAVMCAETVMSQYVKLDP